MNTRKLLPTMIGMILAGNMAVAQAEVQLFGRIDESLAFVNGGKIKNSGGQNFYPFVAKGSNNTDLVCTDCDIGVKGSEDLGNGLKALFLLDYQYDINNSTGLTGRDQWLGLGGSFGTLKAGTMSTVYKGYGKMLDPVYETINQQKNIGLQSNLHNGKGDAGEGRATNTVGYSTPDWSGLSLEATYTIVPDSSTNQPSGSHNNPYSAGVKYENGGLLGFVTYISNNAGSDDSAAAVGAKYDFGKFALFGQYEWDKGLITDSVTGTLGQRNSGDGANVWMVGGTYTMGNNMLYAGYGSDDQAKTTDNTIAVPPAASQKVSVTQFKSWEIVGTHHFSKTTLAYLGYVGSSPDDSNVQNLQLYTLGFKHWF